MMILRWMLLVVLFISVLSFTNGKHHKQLVSLQEINFEFSEKRFVNHETIASLMLENQISFDSTYLNRFQLEELEQCLESHSLIKNVEVFSSQKGDISIDVAQRKAVVRIITKEDSYYLDEYGIAMPVSENYTERVLVASGDVSERNHQDIFQFVSIINKSNFWQAQITQLYLIDNEWILIPRVGAHKIHFGLLTSVKEKLENLYQFYQQAMPLKGWQTYSDISLKYNNQIICTKK